MLEDILNDINRGRRFLSRLISHRIDMEKFGFSIYIKGPDESQNLFNLLQVLEHRVNVEELLDETTQKLYDELIGVIGKADPIIRVPIQFGFYDTKPEALSLTFQFTALVIKGSTSFNLNYTSAAGANKYIAFSQPTDEPIKTKWYNTDLNRGNNIPDAVFEAPVIVGSNRIVISRDPFIFQSTIYDITFST